MLSQILVPEALTLFMHTVENEFNESQIFS